MVGLKATAGVVAVGWPRRVVLFCVVRASGGGGGREEEEERKEVKSQLGFQGCQQTQ